MNCTTYSDQCREALEAGDVKALRGLARSVGAWNSFIRGLASDEVEALHEVIGPDIQTFGQDMKS